MLHVSLTVMNAFHKQIAFTSFQNNKEDCFEVFISEKILTFLVT
jgi:hypothetical protein